jgi:hypothetical protein
VTPQHPTFIERQPCHSQEVVFAKDQDEYLDLPASVSGDGLVTTRWALTDQERLKIYQGGSLYLQVLTFGKPLQPVRLSVEEPNERS